MITGNSVVLMKVLGPVLFAILAFLMYLYARRGLNWSKRKSLLVALLVATYFVSLRCSWDMYRQMLGLIFLMATILSLKAFHSPCRYFLVAGFMVLTVLSHELATVILFFVLLLEGLHLLQKRLGHDVIFLGAASVLPIALFFYQRTSLATGSVSLPSVAVSSEPSLNLALYIVGSLVYCYAFILPLVALGFAHVKDWALVVGCFLGWA
jgi:uncharacterized membrane protein